MRHLLIIPVCALMMACTPAKRYTATATACDLYIASLNAASDLAKQGKLNAEKQLRIDQTVEPARAICTGKAPVDDTEAIRKVSAFAIAVMEATR